MRRGLGPIRRATAERAFAGDSPEAIGRALLRLALHGPDWEYAERAVLAHIAHPAVWVRRNAATSLGHIARMRGSVSEDTVRALVASLADPEVAGYAADSLDDCEIFAGVQRTLS